MPSFTIESAYECDIMTTIDTLSLMLYEAAQRICIPIIGKIHKPIQLHVHLKSRFLHVLINWKISFLFLAVGEVSSRHELWNEYSNTATCSTRKARNTLRLMPPTADVLPRVCAIFSQFCLLTLLAFKSSTFSCLSCQLLILSTEPAYLISFNDQCWLDPRAGKKLQISYAV